MDNRPSTSSARRPPSGVRLFTGKIIEFFDCSVYVCNSISAQIRCCLAVVCYVLIYGESCQRLCALYFIVALIKSYIVLRSISVVLFSLVATHAWMAENHHFEFILEWRWGDWPCISSVIDWSFDAVKWPSRWSNTWLPCIVFSGRFNSTI